MTVGSRHPAHPAIAWAIATVRLAMSACIRSTMRPSICHHALAGVLRQIERRHDARACVTSAASGEKMVLQGPIWLRMDQGLAVEAEVASLLAFRAKPSAVPSRCRRRR